MSRQLVKEQQICETPQETKPEKQKKSALWTWVLGIAGIILTIAMFVAVIYFGDEIRRMQQYGYIGAFFISILGGATIIIPVPMLAVVFALGGAMDNLWDTALLGFSAAAGELIGAYIIYFTGTGAGRAISSKHGRIQKAYEKMLGFIERKGAWALFAVTSVINPFFYPAAFACGALRFGLKKYTLIVTAGKLIKCMTVVYAGYYGLKGIFRAIGVEL
jgi:membrane protein DedA with SNARE-associated domain